MAAETKLAFPGAQGPSELHFRPLFSDTDCSVAGHPKAAATDGGEKEGVSADEAEEERRGEVWKRGRWLW